ncbi:hypothetical protein HGA88_05275 [Candidatus Roizmanbacteria bacterium]|nr:hypothetical protein [Candidatus Roizmanbacteria bacterium]
MKEIPVLLIIGPVGVGKSTVADAICEILTERNIHHAVIDLDQLRYAYPRPSTDRFHVALGYNNLAVIWKNYEAVGATRIVIPNVLEKKSNIKHIEEAVPGAKVIVVRLGASLETIHDRLRGRPQSQKFLEWNLKRADELNATLEREQLEDYIVDTENKSIGEIAEEIVKKIGWLKEE